MSKKKQHRRSTSNSWHNPINSVIVTTLRGHRTGEHVQSEATHHIFEKGGHLKWPEEHGQHPIR